MAPLFPRCPHVSAFKVVEGGVLVLRKLFFQVGDSTDDGFRSLKGKGGQALGPPPERLVFQVAATHAKIEDFTLDTLA